MLSLPLSLPLTPRTSSKLRKMIARAGVAVPTETSHAAGSPAMWASVAVLSVATAEGTGGAGGRAPTRATANAANAMQAPTTKAVV